LLVYIPCHTGDGDNVIKVSHIKCTEVKGGRSRVIYQSGGFQGGKAEMDKKHKSCNNKH